MPALTSNVNEGLANGQLSSTRTTFTLTRLCAWLGLLLLLLLFDLALWRAEGDKRDEGDETFFLRALRFRIVNGQAGASGRKKPDSDTVGGALRVV